MKAVVVYESIYGNTRAVAEAIGAGLAEHGTVAVVHAADADAGALAGADLLVVGGPTHMHGMTTSLTRRMATDGAEEDGHARVDARATDGPGLRAWLAQLPVVTRAAAFDTRIDRSPALTGSAARGIGRRLHHRGCALVAEPESFFVEDGEGPLANGEEARARTWGATLAGAARLAAPTWSTGP